MNIPKRHHFVPQMLLRRFTDGHGKLHLFDKRFPKKGILPISPTNLYVQSNLYTQYGEDGEKDVSVEKRLSELEGEANKIIQKIIDAARNRNVPNLTASEKAAWDHYVFYQWKRVPDVIDKILGDAEFEEYLKDSLEEYESTVRTITAEERKKISDPIVRAGIQRDARVKAVTIPGRDAVKAIADKGLVVALITKPNKSFIIGSHPIVKLTKPDHTHLADPSVELWFPIAHNAAVTPGFSHGTEKLMGINEDRHIRYINKAILRQSTAIAGRSRTLIASLAGVR